MVEFFKYIFAPYLKHWQNNKDVDNISKEELIFRFAHDYLGNLLNTLSPILRDDLICSLLLILNSH
jgi:hypothetical protein